MSTSLMLNLAMKLVWPSYIPCVSGSDVKLLAEHLRTIDSSAFIQLRPWGEQSCYQSITKM